MKRAISIILTTALIFTAISANGITAIALQSGNFQYELVGDAAKIIKYTGIATSVTIPETLDGYTVVRIGNGAFWNKSELLEVIIPDTVIIIGNDAFGACSKLENVIIGNAVSSIGASAFSFCTSLKKIIIPDSVITIKADSFCGCSALEEITLSKNLITIEDNLFNSCGNLKTIKIPDSVERIGNRAFAECISLTEIHIPFSVMTFGEVPFEHCSGLIQFTVDELNQRYSAEEGILYNKNKTYVIKCPEKFFGVCILPESVTRIGDFAFNNCTELTDILFPENLTCIDIGAFEGCTGLYMIIFPNKLTTIGTNAFSGCIGITTLTIPDSVRSIGREAFYECSGLTEVKISKNISGIRQATFAYCTGLREITIPSNVTSIGFQAFYGCSGLIRANISSRITDIDSEAFGSCINLESVYFLGNASAIMFEDAFLNCSPELIIKYYYGKTGFLNSWNVYKTKSIKVTGIVTHRMKTVAGKAVPGSKIMLMANNRAYYCIANSVGEWSKEIDQTMKIGQIINTRVYFEGEKILTKAIYIKPEAPKVNEITQVTKTIVGKTYSNANVKVKLNGTWKSIVAKSTGNFFVKVEKPLDEGVAVVFKVIYKKQISASKTVKVLGSF